MQLTRRAFLLLASLLVVVAPLAPAADKDPFAKWEPEIQKFEQLDKQTAPTPGGVLFIGSSSVKFWDLKKSELPGVNRGFGGSQICDSVHFFDRIVIPHKPAVIVLLAGTNDLNAGKSPATVFADLQAFVKLAHEKLPGARVIFIAGQPSIARWAQREKQVEFNKLAADFIATDPLLSMVPRLDALLGPDGTPDPANYRPDKLHLSEAGYKILNAAVKPVLEKAMAAEKK